MWLFGVCFETGSESRIKQIVILPRNKNTSDIAEGNFKSLRSPSHCCIFRIFSYLTYSEINDLLPDVPQTNDRMAWKAWEQERKRGPVTEEGMLEAYRRGYERGRLSHIELDAFAPGEDDR